MKIAERGYVGAITTYTRLISGYPQSVGTMVYYYKRAKVQYELGQYWKAIGDLTEAIRLIKPYKDINDYKAEFYFWCGLAYHQLKNSHREIEDYTSAVTFDPNHLRAYNNRAAVYFEQRKWVEAIEDMD